MGTPDRLIAWHTELLAVHDRLRAALRTAYESLDAGGPTLSRDLLLYCHGFCVALDGHHRGEDRTLFPALLEDHPELADVVAKLMQDHSMMSHLIAGLEHAVASAAEPDELRRHLDGLAAIMESHFGFEERQVLDALTDLRLIADPRDVLGPL